MPTKEIPCPACKSPILVKVDETARRAIDVPRFCASCGVQIHRRCPKCNKSFSKLTRYCHECGKEVHPPLGLATKQCSLAPASLELLRRLRQDGVDSAWLTREALLVAIRLSPPNFAAQRFYEILSSIDDNTPGPTRAALFGQALDETPGFLDPVALEEWKGKVGNLASLVVQGTRESLDLAMPGWQEHIAHPWIQCPEAHAQQIRLRLEQTITPHLGNLSLILEKHQQMREFLPRYREIMSRSEGWNFVVGLAAGFFGGQLGVLGTQLWEGWKAKSDQDFVQAFSVAADEFEKQALMFLQNTEASARPVVDQVVTELTKCSEAVASGIEQFARQGHPIEPVFHKLHFPAHGVDVDARQFLELVLSNLREQGISYESERNLREICGLDLPSVVQESLIIGCPKCAQKLRIPSQYEELAVTCRSCGHRFDWKRG